MNLRIFRFLPHTEAEGPGKRACIWVQGCPIKCDGCAVPYSWSDDGGYTVNTQEISETIIGTKDIEGVTFLGGEPFYQAEALALIGEKVKQAGLSVLTFTGYTAEYLANSNIKGAKELLAVTDLLIDGPYSKGQSDLKRPWVGSSNQRYVFLTDKYIELQSELNQIPNRLEIKIDVNGLVTVNGMTDFNEFRKIIEEI